MCPKCRFWGSSVLSHLLPASPWVSECMNRRTRRDWVRVPGLNQTKRLLKASAKPHLILPAKPRLHEGAPGSTGQGGLKMWSRRERGDWPGEATCTLPATLCLCRRWTGPQAPHVPAGPARSAPRAGACPLGSPKEGGRPRLPCTKWVTRALKQNSHAPLAYK